jgi:RNA polymerase sigma-70 factor (ECF subfamily)
MNHARKLALFEQNVLPHLSAAYNLARWLTGDGQHAEDIVQEAYLRAFQSFESFRGQDGRAWLLAVVRNTSYTWVKKEKGYQQVEFDEEVHSAVDESPDAETILLSEAALASLQGCLEALPLEFREAIVLRELEGLSYKEISNIAGVPVGTVMSRLSRGRKRLQKCLSGVTT